MTAVYACVRVIAETVASLPLHFYEITPEGNMKATKHPLYRILHDEPNAEMTSFVLRETMLTHLLLWGNAYVQIIRNGRNEVIGLYPLLPENMTVDRDPKTGELIYEYRSGTTGQTHVLSQSEVLHVPGLGFDGIMGNSPIAMERNAIGLGIAAEEYGSKFFANGATPSGVLQHPNVVKDPKRVRESWNAAYGGASNSHKVAVLEEGMSFHPISIPNNEAQFLETRKFQVTEICRIFRVPPHLVGDLDHATFSNIEHQSISFGVHTIRPWLTRIEQAMNKALLSKSEKTRYFVAFNMDGLLRGDYKSRMEGYAIARQNGWMSANDIRELENLNPMPPEAGGDVYLVNGNMTMITPASVADRMRALDMERADIEMDALKLQQKSLDRSQQIALEQAEAQLEEITLRNASAKAQADMDQKAGKLTEANMNENSEIAMQMARLQLEQLEIQVQQLRMQLEAAETAAESDEESTEPEEPNAENAQENAQGNAEYAKGAEQEGSESPPEEEDQS